MPDLVEERVREELELSGLTPDDMRVRVLANPERATTQIPSGVQGYVIPYYDLDGKPIAFYRVKAFDHDPKYKQIKNLGNHIYFPKGVKALIEREGYVIITEGEKKAAAATKNGFPCVALSGVDSWRNRTLTIPQDSKLNRIPGKEALSLKLDEETMQALESESTLAVGLQNLIDMCVSRKLTVLLCYDTDHGGIAFDVQRAMATFAFEMRYKGVNYTKIKQAMIPSDGDRKWGIDDFLKERGAPKFAGIVKAALNNLKGFPLHPNIQDYISKKLGKQRIQRKEAQQIAIAVLTDLDTRGNRLRNKDTGQMYFFDSASRTLMDASLMRQHSDILVDTEFARYLWQVYNIGPSDVRVLQWVATLFTAEQPIGLVTPSKVITNRGDTICYQINDGQYIAISPKSDKPFVICDNGTNEVLFESGLVAQLDANEVLRECMAQLKDPLEPLWPKVLEEVRLKNKGNFRKLLSLLFYMSPWINRWRGTQLPIEMALGEPGSGKSSLYEIRLQILVGSPDLRNAPNDLKDWYASIASTGGLHVTDNVQMMDKMLRQRLSDEMCRLVTEAFPHVEMRKYFTNADLMKMPINATFAITAVQQPFHNADLMQRSIMIEFDKGEEQVEYLSKWSTMQIDRFGGRIRWLGHQLSVLHLFLKESTKLWDDRYRAKYRLMNVEQAFIMMARVLKMDTDWIPGYLNTAAIEATRDADWAFEGICAFVDEVKATPLKQGTHHKFTARDIAEWATLEEDFKNCNQLTNVRSLGRYLQSHKQMLSTVCGLRDNGKYANRDTYTIDTSVVYKSPNR